jgi:hypothetical protein
LKETPPRPLFPPPSPTSGAASGVDQHTTVSRNLNPFGDSEKSFLDTGLSPSSGNGKDHPVHSNPFDDDECGVTKAPTRLPREPLIPIAQLTELEDLGFKQEAVNRMWSTSINGKVGDFDLVKASLIKLTFDEIRGNGVTAYVLSSWLSPLIVKVGAWLPNYRDPKIGRLSAGIKISICFRRK